MSMQEFAEKYVKRSIPVDLEWHNPLRMRGDGFRRPHDCAFRLIFKHRGDTDLSVVFTCGVEYAPGISYLEGLRYLRRRLSYTHAALQAGGTLDDQFAAWGETGIRARISGMAFGVERKRSFYSHISVYEATREFMGDEIFMEFLDARDGRSTDGED